MTNQEINEAVARKLHPDPADLDPLKPKTWDQPWKISIPDYCHSIEAAWDIMEYLAPKYFGISIGHGTNPDFWQCEIHGKGWNKIYERAATGPLAICLAFLKLEDK